MVALRLLPVIWRRAALATVLWLAAGLAAVALFPASGNFMLGPRNIGGFVVLGFLAAAVARRVTVEDILREEREYPASLPVPPLGEAALRLGAGAAVVALAGLAMGAVARVARTPGHADLGLALGWALGVFGATAFLAAWSARREWMQQAGVVAFVGASFGATQAAGQLHGAPWTVGLVLAPPLLLAAAAALARKEAFAPAEPGVRSPLGRAALHALAAGLVVGPWAVLLWSAADWIAPFTPVPAPIVAVPVFAAGAGAAWLVRRLSPWGIVLAFMLAAMLGQIATGWIRVFRTVEIRASVEGASIVVDGVDRGPGPVVLRGIRFGDFGPKIGGFTLTESLDPLPALTAEGALIATDLGTLRIAVRYEGKPVEEGQIYGYRATRNFECATDVRLHLELPEVQAAVRRVAKDVRARRGEFNDADVQAVEALGPAGLDRLNALVVADGTRRLRPLHDALAARRWRVAEARTPEARLALAREIFAEIERRCRRDRGWNVSPDRALDCLRAIGMLGKDALPAFLPPEAHPRNPFLALILGEIGDPAGLPEIVKLLPADLQALSPHPHELQAIAKIGGPEATRVLLDLWRRCEEVGPPTRIIQGEVRDSAFHVFPPIALAHALVRTGAPEALEPLRKFFEGGYFEAKDWVPDFETDAEVYLVALGSPEAKALLATLKAGQEGREKRKDRK